MGVVRPKRLKLAMEGVEVPPGCSGLREQGS